VLALTATAQPAHPDLVQTAEREAIVEKECPTTKPQKVQIVQHSVAGGFWCAAWLFTIGYLHLSFWKAVFAIVIWPYYIGAHVSSWTR
jgi:hypothetical protein